MPVNIFFMDQDKLPRKTRKKKAPKAVEPSPTPTPAKINIDIAPLSVEESQLFLNHINAFLEKREHPKRENISDYRALQNTTNEFLESFVTFGYTYSGERVLIQHYPTPRDKDAILEFLKNVFVANTTMETSFDQDDGSQDNE
jgi:hypothetical protein